MGTAPEPPYVAVIFTTRRAGESDGYEQTAARMREMACQSDGFLGIESARDPDGTAITVSYWRDEASARRWRLDPEHLAAQQAGRERWYESYEVRIARVERARSFERPEA